MFCLLGSLGKLFRGIPYNTRNLILTRNRILFVQRRDEKCIVTPNRGDPKGQSTVLITELDIDLGKLDSRGHPEKIRLSSVGSKITWNRGHALIMEPCDHCSRRKFPECSLNVPWMFPECSLIVPWMFPECSLNAPWMFTETGPPRPGCWPLVLPSLIRCGKCGQNREGHLLWIAFHCWYGTDGTERIEVITCCELAAGVWFPPAA